MPAAASALRENQSVPPQEKPIHRGGQPSLALHVDLFVARHQDANRVLCHARISAAAWADHFSRARPDSFWKAPQPLSKAISQFEDRLGIRFFVRTRRKTRLTSAGEALLPEARRILDAAERARETLQAIACGRKGRLRIALSEGTAHSRMAKLLRECGQEDPEIFMTVRQRSLAEQLDELRDDLIDLGVVLSPAENPAHPRSLTTISCG